MKNIFQKGYHPSKDIMPVQFKNGNDDRQFRW